MDNRVTPQNLLLLLGLAVILLWPPSKAWSHKKESIHYLCEMAPVECLEQLPALLQDAKGRLFYRYKMYQLDALVNLGRFKELEAALSPWLDNEDIPVRFRVTVLTYHAKVLYVMKKYQQADIWLTQAVELMSKMNQNLVNPSTMIEIANLQVYLNQIETAHHTLRQLEARHSRHASPKFMQELYANLARVMYKQGNLQQHLAYRKQSLHWSEQVGNSQQIAVSWHNVARSYQFLQQYPDAEQAFITASDHAKLASDRTTLMQCLLYRADIAVQLQQHDKARELIRLIEPHHLSPVRQDLFSHLQQQLTHP